MSVWTAAAVTLLVCIAPLLLLALRGGLIDAVIALQLTGVLAILVLLLLTEAVSDTALADPAVVLAILTLGAGLVYLHFLERWV